MQENYKILGVSENATDEEIDKAYNELKNKYMQDRFLEGEAGNLAAKNLTKLETAYSEIRSDRSQRPNFEDGADNFADIEKLIKDGNLSDAQSKLDAFSERNAEWHYLQSVVFYKKNWMNESRKQLELALELDPNNSKYKDSKEKLEKFINNNGNRFHSGNANFQNTNTGTSQTDRQMGGDGCSSMAECCATYCLMNMLCNICCRL